MKTNKKDNQSNPMSLIKILKDKKIRKHLLILLIGILIACIGSLFAKYNKVFAIVSVIGIGMSFASTNQIMKLIQSS